MSDTSSESDLREEPKQEIVGRVPGWFTHWGISLVTGAMIIFLGASWFISFPEVVTAPILLTADNPPVSLVARTDGRIQHLLVGDRQHVPKDSFLAVLENPADFQEVLQVREMLEGMQRASPDSIRLYAFPRSAVLGEMQPGYSAFLKSVDEYRNFLKSGLYSKRIAALSHELVVQRRLRQSLLAQDSILTKDLEITLAQLARDSSLVQKGMLSKLDLEKTESAVLQKELNRENVRYSMASLMVQAATVENSIVELSTEEVETMKNLVRSLDESRSNLVGRIDSWEEEYIIKSPVAGIVSFAKYWKANQFVKAGDLAFSVIPSDTSLVIGRISMPVYGSGRVHVGQRVVVMCSNYPHTEFGVVEGLVKNVSLVSVDGVFLVDVSFPEGLRTNYGRNLPLSQQLEGTAEIVTEDHRLLERVIMPLRSVLGRNRARSL